MTPGSPRRACAVCGNADCAQAYCTFDALEYLQCSRCGLVYVNSIPDEVAMNTAYTGGVVRKLPRRLFAPYRKLHHHKHFRRSMARARRIIDFAVTHVAGGRSAVRFLDIGCNRGYLLAAALEHGAEVYGIELVPEMVRPFCNTYPHLRERVFSRKLSQVAPQMRDGMFDLVTAIDVIEHLEDPAADLAHIHRLLQPGGAFVIQTPDAGGANARSEKCTWGALKPLEHLHLFNRANIGALAAAAGFQVDHVGEPFELADGNFVAVLRKRTASAGEELRLRRAETVG